MTELEKADRISFLYGKILDNQDWGISELDELLDLSRKDGIEWQQARQSPWVSVEERLPENRQTVFVSSHIYGKTALTWDGVAMLWMWTDSEEFYCERDNIDAWMPIPESP